MRLKELSVIPRGRSAAEGGGGEQADGPQARHDHMHRSARPTRTKS